MNSQKILFVDRDGCLIAEPADFQIDSIDKLAFLPGVFSALNRIQAAGYDLVMVTNQDGLGTASFPEADFWPVHNLMLKIFSSQGVCFREVCIDRHFPHEASDTRKPKIGMVLDYLRNGFDQASSAMVGDRITDMQFASNLGVRGLRIADQHTQDSQDLNTLSYQSAADWAGIAALLLDAPRTATVERNTRETKIRVAVNLDATAPLRAHTGIGFFDHMLEQLGKHGGFSLSLDCIGDLEIDEHHTIEDCALALGQALKTALGDKRGIGRYAFVLPMDETLVQAQLDINPVPTIEPVSPSPVSLVALDLSGRPYFVFDGQIDRKHIGTFPTELFPHFFRSLCETLGANLRLKVQGENDHHQIEASFKAVARCLRQAIARTGDVLPSTKGML